MGESERARDAGIGLSVYRSTYLRPVAKSVSLIVSVPRMALTNSCSTRQPAASADAMATSSSAPPRLPKRSDLAAISRCTVPSVPYLHVSACGWVRWWWWPVDRYIWHMFACISTACVCDSQSSVTTRSGCTLRCNLQPETFGIFREPCDRRELKACLCATCHGGKDVDVIWDANLFAPSLFHVDLGVTMNNRITISCALLGRKNAALDRCA